MKSSPLTLRSSAFNRSVVVLGIATLVAIAYAVPFYGFPISLCIPVVTHKARHHLWPDASKTASKRLSIAAWVGLWMPALLDLLTPVFYNAGMEVSTTWLIIPLCGAVGRNVVVLPALAAGVTCLAGALATVVTRRAGFWVAAAWLAPWMHYAVFTQIPHEYVC